MTLQGNERSTGLPNEMPSTVFVVDDDPLMCSFIQELVKADDRTTEAFVSAREFLASFDPLRPGCLVCDVCMPGMSGLELQLELNLRGAVLPVIFISGRSDVPTAVAAMRQGAFDFIVKPFTDDELTTRVQSALERDRETRCSLLEIEQMRVLRESLTRREQEVFERLCTGLSNKAMASDLGLSMRTIELHRARVMEKMAAKSVAHLVRIMLELERPRTPR